MKGLKRRYVLVASVLIMSLVYGTLSFPAYSEAKVKTGVYSNDYYDISVKKLSGKKVKVQIFNYVGQWGNMYQSKVIKAKVKNNKIKFNIHGDGGLYANYKGYIKFYNKKIKCKINGDKVTLKLRSKKVYL